GCTLSVGREVKMEIPAQSIPGEGGNFVKRPFVTPRLALLAILACSFALVASAQVYTIRDLGPISPIAINKSGHIAALNSKNHAVLVKEGLVVDLGVLPGGTFSVPTAINDVGAVV